MTAREAFERWYSNEGTWPQAVARDSNGQYRLASACAAWSAWEAAWDAGSREALAEREFVHAESSRIYAMLASAVRNDATDTELAQLLRDAVRDRGRK